MRPVTGFQRGYFATVGAFAAWVGAWGTFLPTKVDHALPWMVPPLHARFLGAVYFSAAVLLFGGMAARLYAEVRAMVPVIAVWTGSLLVVSLFHLGEFDFGHRPVWFWFFAYVLYPLIGFALMWRYRGLEDEVEGARLPAWTARFFQALFVTLVLLAAALLLAQELMASLWPWKISPLLVQIYSAPFLAYGISCGMLARRRNWPEVRLVVYGLLVFTGGALAASILHRGLFDPARTATWVWFGGFSLVTATLLALVVRHLRRG